jgi:O-antigen ligase
MCDWKTPLSDQHHKPKGVAIVNTERYAPWVLLAGFLASASLSWLLRSAIAGTLLGVFLIVTLMPITSFRGGIAAGSLIGGVAGALAETVLFAPEREVGRIFIATAYGVLLGALWGIVIVIVGRMRSRGSTRQDGGSGNGTRQQTDQQPAQPREEPGSQ